MHLAADDSEDGTFIKSALKKEIVYDEKAGRFFETGYGEGDCIPSEEYCYLDKETGDNIRLTVEEKERIFLDALQVSSTCYRSIPSIPSCKVQWAIFPRCCHNSLRYVFFVSMPRHITQVAGKC